jgi:hypothetical protein
VPSSKFSAMAMPNGSYETQDAITVSLKDLEDGNVLPGSVDTMRIVYDR